MMMREKKMNENLKVCPICGKVIGFNSYFGTYNCEECGWEWSSKYE